MSPIQQMLLGVGAVAKKSYIDDIFSNFLYTGTGSARSINNALDVSGEGAMVWIKSRNLALSHQIFDTVRGATKVIASDNTYADWASTTTLTAFNNNGFSLGTNSAVNSSGDTYSSWTFRKAPGFFDVVTWTGDGSSNRQISHSLSSVPGLIMVKKTSESDNWNVYHRSAHTTSPEDYRLFLNSSAAASTNDSAWNETKPTSSNFTVGSNDQVNGNGKSYVAYVFAGGKGSSDSAVSFDGSSSLTVANGSGIDIGTNDFTMECFINVQTSTSPGNHDVICASSLYLTGTGNSFTMYAYDNGGIRIFRSLSGSWTASAVTDVYSLNAWTHVAWVRKGTSSNNNKVYVNGKMVMEFSDNTNYSSGQKFYLGASDYDQAGTPDEYGLTGKISNFRFTNGQALYTNNFNPPLDPLTTSSQGANSSNVKLLCCNGSSTTSSTVTPGTITSTGSTSVTTNNSIFDDTAANIFGDAGESVIKCGSYVGNGSSTGPEINLGWSPAFLIIKNITDSEGWVMFDEMRGMYAGGNDKALFPNQTTVEQNRASGQIWPTSTGFKLDGSSDGKVNGNNKNYVFLAIRRSDGYVGKPPSLGTDVFAMDTGAGSSTIPNFDSGFPVDFQFLRQPASTYNWYTGARLLGNKYLATNNDDGEGAASATGWVFDSNEGWNAHSGYNSTYQSWMWKRHAGFDVVAYEGDSVLGRQIQHSLNKTIEMIWIKNRDTNGRPWCIGHKDMASSNVWSYFLEFDTDQAAQDNDRWNSTAPTSTHFTVGNSTRTNKDNATYIAMLFASVDGISKVGSYTGNGSTTGTSVTTGFTVRFLIIKSTASDSWMVFDTLREFTSTDSKYLQLNTSGAQEDITLVKQITNGFQLSSTFSGVNSSNQSYIYYAHS